MRSALADADRGVTKSVAGKNSSAPTYFNQKGPLHDLSGSAKADPTGEPIIVDPRTMFREIARDVDACVSTQDIARRFHATMVEMIFQVCRRVREETGIHDVVFSGGVFMNALLSCAGYSRLTGDGFRVYRHHLVPANDGGLCLGQLAVAAARSNAT